jgi:hypothetical protein
MEAGNFFVDSHADSALACEMRVSLISWAPPLSMTCPMPTYYKAQFIDAAMPWLAVWDIMRDGLLPDARQILAALQYYSERDLEPLSSDVPLSAEEESELVPIISALTVAGVQSEAMKDGVLISTLMQVAKRPGLFYEHELPVAVQWELAQDIQRDAEPPGTYSMDVWGTDQTRIPYIFGSPAEEVVAGAATRALHRNQANRSAGRPEHPAHRELAERLGPIFGASEQPIWRRKEKVVRRQHGEEFLDYAEGGPFFNFLELVLPPLRKFLQERRLPPVTVETVVRLAMSHSKRGRRE